MAYKKLIKVSNVCQLVDKSKFAATGTRDGITWTNNNDGTITANGTATAETNYVIWLNLPLGHKYLVCGCPQGGSHSSYLFWGHYVKYNSQGSFQEYGSGVIISTTDFGYESLFYIYMTYRKGQTATNQIWKPQIFDLTEMYGAGHEPTTVAQFRQDFPDEMYDYKPYCFVKSYKTLLKVSNVCQLLDKSKFATTGTLNGVTFHNNGDGSYTLNGTSTDYIYFNFYKLDKKLRAGVVQGVISSAGYYGEDCWYDINNHLVFYLIGTGQTFNNQIIRPQIFDLTEMYGAGHEPTTVEQFRQDFPEKMYDYKPYCFVKSYKKSLICKTKNLLDINNAYSLGGVNSFDTFSINGNSITATVSNLNSNVVILRLFLGDLSAGSYCFSCSVSIENSTLDSRPNEFLVFTDDGSMVTIERGFSNGDYSVNFTFNCSSSGVFRLDFYRNILPIPTESLSDTVYRVTFSNIQIERGDTATDYVPYGHL